MGCIIRILITGGAGFIGSNLAAKLIRAGETVVVLDNFSTGLVSNTSTLDCEVIEGDVLDASLVLESMRGCDAVVHLAALPSVPRSLVTPRESFSVNALGTLNVLEAARTHGSYIVASGSSSVYGLNPSPLKVETLPTSPISPYAASKVASEALVIAYGAAYQIPALSFRFFNVYGPLQRADHAYAAVIPRFIEAAIHGDVATLHGDGSQFRDFTFVNSVTAVIHSAIVGRVTHDGPVNLAFGQGATLNDIIGLIEESTGKVLSLKREPFRSGDIHRSQADPSILRSLFPLVEPTPLKSGIEQTVNWFKFLGHLR